MAFVRLHLFTNVCKNTRIEIGKLSKLHKERNYSHLKTASNLGVPLIDLNDQNEFHKQSNKQYTH